ncbi:MAG: hypothetical protein RSG75_11055, partial [Cellulosilyticaceae bacterium]
MSGIKVLKKRVALLLVSIMIIANSPVYGMTPQVIASQPVPVEIKWTRSSEDSNDRPPNQEERTWSWETANSIATPIVGERVWDANTDNPYYTGYITKTEHPAATWSLRGSAWPQADLRRFRGEFEIPEGYTTKDYVSLKSIRQDAYQDIKGGNIIPINDNIYIFVYPTKVAKDLNDDANSEHYFMKYLAFWSGTANRESHGIQKFGEMSGTRSWHTPGNELLRLTDGWYAEAEMDNIGNTMHQTTGGKESGTDFVIDVFTEENSGGGGMDQLILEFKHNPAHAVVAKGENYVILQDKEVTIETEKGLLKNDVPTGLVTSKLLEEEVDGFNVSKNAEGTYDITKDNQRVAVIKEFDKKGQFKMDPTDGYVGEIKFKYNVSDKLKDNKDAIATLYVLPKLSIEHIDQETKELIYKSDTPIYGNPYGDIEGDTLYLEGTDKIGPTYQVKEAEEVKQKNKDYKFVEGHVIDSSETITEVPYEHTFKADNQTIQLHYSKKYPYKINYFIDQTTTPVPGINTPVKGSEYPGYTIAIEHPTSDKGYAVKVNQPTSLEITPHPNANEQTVYYIIDQGQNYPYTVNYLEEGTNKSLASSKKALGGPLGTIIDNEQQIEIQGYKPVSEKVDAMTIQANEDENVINIYYTKENYSYEIIHQYVSGNVVTDKVSTTSMIKFDELIAENPYTLENVKAGYHYTTTSVIGIRDYAVNESGSVTGIVPANPDNNTIIITFTYEANPYTLDIKHTYYDIDGNENLALATTSSERVVYDQEIVEGPQAAVEGYTYTNLLVDGISQDAAKAYKDTIKGDLTLEFIYKEAKANLIVEHKYSEDRDKNFDSHIAVRGGDTTWADAYDDTSARGAYPVDAKYYVSRIILTTQQTTGSAIRTTGPAIEVTSTDIGLRDLVDIAYGVDYKITIEYDMQYYNLTERHIYEGLSEEEQEEHTKIKYGETLGVSARDKSGYILDKITVDGRPVDLTQDIAIWMDGDKEVIFYYVKKQTPVPNPDPSPEPTPDPEPTP